MFSVLGSFLFSKKNHFWQLVPKTRSPNRPLPPQKKVQIGVPILLKQDNSHETTNLGTEKPKPKIQVITNSSYSNKKNNSLIKVQN